MWYMLENVQQSYDLSDRLIRAISNWRLEDGDDEVEDLLDQGADVNRLHGTLLPLHCASMVRDVDCLSLLLQHGASVNAIDGYGRSALHYAAEVDSNCVELLLMQSETLVDIGDGNQNTPLHWASYKNNVESMIILLDRGADVDAMDYNHETPLSWAAKKSNLEAVKVLLQYNAKPNIVDFNGYMPLEHVANMIARGLGGKLEDTVMELLLKAMGQFDLRDDTGQLSEPISSDNKLNEILVPYCVGARPLKELCRYAIRSYLGRSYLPNIIPRLPVPVPLQEYLQLQR